MKLSDVVFIDTFPTLDLHGFDCASARVKINEFIQDNFLMGNEFVTIVHGIGSGALRRETKETLQRNKNVLEYQLFRGNIGCTIAKIKKMKKLSKKFDNEKKLW